MKQDEKWLVGVCGVATVCCVLVFNLAFFLRYSPLSEGWFSEYALLLNGGKHLYRDLYCFLPPLYPWLIAAITRIFGYDISVLRWFGVAIMIAFSLTLFSIVRRFGGAVSAFVSTVATVVYYQSGNAHIAYDFIQVMNLATLLGCFALLKFHEANQGLPAISRYAWVVAAGIFGGCAFYIKHSNGLFIIAFSALAAAILGYRWGLRASTRVLSVYILGFGIVSFAIALLLIANGSFLDCIKLLVGGATSAKGGLLTAFFAFIPRTFDLHFFSRMVVVWIFCIALGFGQRRKLLGGLARIGDGGIQSFLCFLLPAFGLLLFSILFPRFSSGGLPVWVYSFVMPKPDIVNEVTLLMVPLAVMGTAMGLAFWLCNPTFRSSSFGVVIVPTLIALGMQWGNATSGGFSEAGAFLAIGVLFSLLLDHGGWYGCGAAIFTVVLAWQSSVVAEVKYATPYAWWGLRDPDVRLPRVPGNQPILQNLLLTSKQNHLFDRITDDILRETDRGERILVFPQTPIFYLLTGRDVPGNAVVHWFDFLPDKLAIKEASILKSSPPKLIVMMEMPDEVWIAHETLFRGGKPSGQREIVRTVNKMVIDGEFF